MWGSRTAYRILYMRIIKPMYSIYLHWKYLNGRVAASNSQPESPLDKRLLGVSVKCTSSQKYDSIVKYCYTKVKKMKHFSKFKNNIINIV